MLDVTFINFVSAAAKSLQSCPTLCNPIDGSPPGSTIPGILQARTLEWGAIAFSNFVSTHTKKWWRVDTIILASKIGLSSEALVGVLLGVSGDEIPVHLWLQSSFLYKHSAKLSRQNRELRCPSSQE